MSETPEEVARAFDAPLNVWQFGKMDNNALVGIMKRARAIASTFDSEEDPWLDTVLFWRGVAREELDNRFSYCSERCRKMELMAFRFIRGFSYCPYCGSPMVHEEPIYKGV